MRGGGKMANEDVSRIMQSKPHLRYSPAFVHIKMFNSLSVLSFHTRIRVCAFEIT